MTSKTKITLAAALIAAFATPALAQDEWIVDSGRYVNGQVPSYVATQTPRLFEGRNAAVINHEQATPDRTTALGN